MSRSGDRLPLINKLLYTSDMVGSQAVAQTRNLWLLFFLAPPASVSSTAAVPPIDLGPFALDSRVFIGLVLTAGRFIEAFDDPIIGWWSDHTRSRWGRRLPFILLATPFYGIFFALLWITPVDGASLVNAVYIFVILELFFLSNTLSGGPYESLLPEVARSHIDRMSIVGWQFYFGILGAALGLTLTGVIQDAFGFQVMGLVIAGSGLAFRYLGLRGVWNHAPRETPSAHMSLRDAFAATLSNKQFLYFVPTFVFFQLAVAMVIAWLPFFVSEIVQPASGGTATALLTVLALAAMSVSVVLLWKLSNARGKRWVYSACLLGSAIYLPFLYFAGFVPGIPPLLQGAVMAFLAGLPMAGVNLMPKAITADITDYDEILTGMRREGMFFATQNLFEKVGSSFSALLLAVVLLLGETASDPLGIRMVGPIAGVMAFLGFLLFRGYRLPSTVTLETVAAAGLDVTRRSIKG